MYISSFYLKRVKKNITSKQKHIHMNIISV